MNMPDADFLFEFRKFLDKHVDCRLEAVLTEGNRTASHEDRTGDLESKTEDLASEQSYHEDRITELETYEDRIADLENSLELLSRFKKQEVQALVDSRLKHLILAGDLHLNLTTRNES